MGLSSRLRIGVADMDLAAAASAPTEGSDVSEKLLHVCKLGGSTEVDALLAAGADPNFQGGPGGEAPLHWAARKGDRTMLATLMNANACLDARDADQQTPLMLAARNGQYHVLKPLLEAKAEVNAQDSRGETALHAAAALGSVRLVKLLINNGIAVEIRDKEGNTAADTAGEAGNTAAEDLINEKLG